MRSDELCVAVSRKSGRCQREAVIEGYCRHHYQSFLLGHLKNVHETTGKIRGSN